MKKVFAALFMLFFLFSPSLSLAADLMDIYFTAREHDAAFKQEKEKYYANLEVLPEQVATYLPNISATGQVLHNRLDSRGSNHDFQKTGVFKYNNELYGLNLTQPLLNFENWEKIKQAKAQTKQAIYHFQAVSQDLIIRTVQTYFQVLLAQDELDYAIAQQQATAKRLYQAKVRLRVGVIAITALYDAQAAYSRDTANVIAKENELRGRYEQLRQLTGEQYPSLARMRAEIPLHNPIPNDIMFWEKHANLHNRTLRESYYAKLAERENLAVRQAQHLPIVNFVANMGRNAQGSIGFGTTDAFNQYAGVQVILPIFSGGSVMAQSREAEHNYKAALYNELGQRRKAVNDVRQAFLAIISGRNKIQADQQAILFGKSAVNSNEESYRLGTRTILDVLDAQSKLFQSQVQFSSDRYAYILNQLMLKQAAGNLTIADLKQANALLDSKQLITLPTDIKYTKLDVADQAQ